MSVYYRVGGALLVLMVLTISLSFFNLGPLNFVAAYTIAFAKALLVAFFFMELRTSSRVLWMLAAAGLVWLLLLIGGTLGDVMTRSAISLPTEPLQSVISAL